MGDTGPAAEESRVRRALKRSRSAATESSGKTRVVALVAVLLLVTAPFGGLTKAPEPKLEPLKTHKTYRIGPFDVTVLGLGTFNRISAGEREVEKPSRKKNRLFVLEARIHSRSREPQYVGLVSTIFGGDHTGVVARKGETSPRANVYSFDDGTSPEMINPGLTYDLAFVYEQDGSWENHPIDLVLNGFEYLETDPLTLDPGRWLAVAPRYRGRIPVQVKNV